MRSPPRGACRPAAPTQEELLAEILVELKTERRENGVTFMTAQGEKPCAVLFGRRSGAGGMNPPLRVNRKRAVPEGRGRVPLQRGAPCSRAASPLAAARVKTLPTMQT